MSKRYISITKYRDYTEDKINEWIDILNRNVYANIERASRKINSFRRLIDYLEANGYVDHFGTELSDSNIRKFINLLSGIEEEEEELSVTTDDEHFLTTNQMIDLNEVAPDLLNGLLSRYNYYANEHNQIRSINDLEGDSPQEKLVYLAKLVNQLPLSKSSGGGGTRSKVGMGLIQEICRLKRDIKRVSKAMSPKGAQDIVDKHNRGKPESSHWLMIHKDVDGDNVPDVVIANRKGEPLYFNGYTTTKSDWPIRYNYYKDHPTPESRRGKSMSQYAHELYDIKYNEPEDVEDMHELGVRVSGGLPAAFANYNMDGYKQPSAREKLSGYQRFQKYVIKRYTEPVINYLETNHQLHVPPKYKVRLIAKASALLWKHLILTRIANRHGFNVESKQFNEAKKKYSKEINDEVSDLLNHLSFTRDGWSEQDRQNLDRHVGDMFATMLLNAAGTMTGSNEMIGGEYGQPFSHVDQPNAFAAHQNPFNDEGHTWEHDEDFKPGEDEHWFD